MVPRIVAVAAVLLSCLYCVACLSVSGNKILDKNGNSVLLRGVVRPSFEWSATGESSSLADYQNMRSWGANVVRIPLNQDFWLSGSATYSSNYANVIDQQIAWAEQAGLYVIIDLHWSDQGNLLLSSGTQQIMADGNSVTFWTQVATRYKNDLNVMFELYNEPHDVAWPIWLNGGVSGFNVIGMQNLTNAVRATGATNICIIGGLNWAFDLSGVAAYPIKGSNIAYATHPYDYPGKQLSNWDAAFGYLVPNYPVIMTEFGQYCNSDTYVNDLLTYANSKGIHWTAWAWYPSDCSFPALITNWAGSASPVGLTVKSFLSKASTTTLSTTATVKISSTSTTAAVKTSTTSTTAAVKISTTTTTGGSTGVISIASGTYIFDDQFENGWQDYSWATVSKTATAYVLSGTYSFSFTLAAYAGAYFHFGLSTVLTVGSYSSLQFSVNGGTVSPTQLVVKVYDNSATPVAIGNAVALPNAVVANKWTIETLPLSSFGLASTTRITGLVILYNQNNNGGTIYLDNILLQ